MTKLLQNSTSATIMISAPRHRQEKDLCFSYPLKKKTVKNLKIVSETVAVLTVIGKAYLNHNAPVTEPYERWSADIDHVFYNGTDILPVLQSDVMIGLDDIEEEAYRQAAKIFEPLSSINLGNSFNTFKTAI